MIHKFDHISKVFGTGSIVFVFIPCYTYICLFLLILCTPVQIKYISLTSKALMFPMIRIYSIKPYDLGDVNNSYVTVFLLYIQLILIATCNI